MPEYKPIEVSVIRHHSFVTEQEKHSFKVTEKHDSYMNAFKTMIDLSKETSSGKMSLKKDIFKDSALDVMRHAVEETIKDNGFKCYSNNPHAIDLEIYNAVDFGLRRGAEPHAIFAEALRNIANADDVMFADPKKE